VSPTWSLHCEALDLIYDLEEQGVRASPESAEDGAIVAVCAPPAHKSRLRRPLLRQYACELKWIDTLASQDSEATRPLQAPRNGAAARNGLVRDDSLHRDGDGSREATASFVGGNGRGEAGASFVGGDGRREAGASSGGGDQDDDAATNELLAVVNAKMPAIAGAGERSATDLSDFALSGTPASDRDIEAAALCDWAVAAAAAAAVAHGAAGALRSESAAGDSAGDAPRVDRPPENGHQSGQTEGVPIAPIGAEPDVTTEPEHLGESTGSAVDSPVDTCPPTGASSGAAGDAGVAGEAGGAHRFQIFASVELTVGVCCSRAYGRAYELTWIADC
jgi:hypothetical protein